MNVTKVTFTNVLALTVAALGRLNIRANSPKKSLKLSFDLHKSN